MDLFIGAFILSGVALLIWGVRLYRHSGGNRIATAREAVNACNSLLQLVAHLQQHRGMSTAWLAGDTSFVQRLGSKRIEIDGLLAKLQQLAVAENAHAYPCFTPNDVSLWRHRWSVLVSELSGYTVEKSIATHSNLIATLLNWLAAIGEARIELPMGNQLSAGTVRNYAHRLPQLTETLGQARATGSGVAAQGHCAAVARVRLMFLVSRAESLIDQACAVDRQGGAAAQKVKSLANIIRTKMLSSQHVEVSAEAYFAEATAAIDAVFQWVSDCGHVLENEIGQAEGGYSGLVASPARK